MDIDDSDSKALWVAHKPLIGPGGGVLRIPHHSNSLSGPFGIATAQGKPW